MMLLEQRVLAVGGVFWWMTNIYTTEWAGGPIGPAFFLMFTDVVPISTGSGDYHLEGIGDRKEEQKRRRLEMEALALLLLLQK